MNFTVLDIFEHELCKYTGAPYAVPVDCCTHAIEVCMRYQGITGTVTMPKRTYISALMVLHKLGLSVEFTDEDWTYEYNYGNTNIWDSARGLQKNMYRPGQMQCLSFGRTKRLEIGRGGAILVGNYNDYVMLKRMAWDGRDLTVSPWQTQTDWTVGYHYNMRLEDAVLATEMIRENNLKSLESQIVEYPDVSILNIKV